MEWDAENGVWKGNAAASQLEHLPDPLYIFGYGSLLWKPGDLMGQFESFPCSCSGFVRLFAQRSMDHRGTSDFPGFVVTLVKEDELEEQHQHSQQQGDVYLPECIGNVYLVPQEQARELIEELDFREKGGYHRHLISVKLLKPTPFHEKLEHATALVYTGSANNPNFCIRGKDDVAGVIASAIGQSGENAEYFLNLTSYIRSHNLVEKYLWDLEKEMLKRMCFWRAKRYMQTMGLHSLSWNDLSAPPNVFSVVGDSGAARLAGWGSNEYEQLLSFSHDKHKEEEIIPLVQELSTLDATSDQSPPRYIFPCKVVCGGSASVVLSDNGQLYIWGGQPHDKQQLAESIYILNDNSLSSGDVSATSSHFSLINGVENVSAGHEALLLLLKNGKVVSMGRNTFGECYPSKLSRKDSNSGVIDSHYLFFSQAAGVFSKSIVPSKDGETNDLDSASAVVKDVEEIVYLAAGLRHSLAVSKSGSVYAWGDCRYFPVDSHTWYPPPPGGGTVEKTTESTGVPLRHLHLNVPIRILNASCGAKHSVLVDNLGRMWSFGDNSFGQLGRDIVLDNTTAEMTTDSKGKHRRSKVDKEPAEVKVDLGTPSIRWLKVSCGWSHNIAKGISQDGSFLFAAWGRNDMGQLPLHKDDGDTTKHSLFVPYPERVLPISVNPFKIIREMWCGSEFTIAADSDGFLWGCGWDEHGNLANKPNFHQANDGTPPELLSSQTVPSHESKWTEILRLQTSDLSSVDRDEKNLQQVQLLDVWEGALSCGGAHCLAFVS